MNTGSSPLVGQATATEHVIRKKSVMLETTKISTPCYKKPILLNVEKIILRL